MRWIAVAVLALSFPPAAAAQVAQGAQGARDRVPVNPGGSPVGPFTPAIKSMGGLIWVSGQIGNAPGTRGVVPGGIGPETRQTMENLGRVLEAAGSSFARVVKCTVFLTDINEWPAMNAVYATYFSGDPPARSAVQVSGLVFGARVEIDCIALAG
jgi:reactive intermediate/imine deaminase